MHPLGFAEGPSPRSMVRCQLESPSVFQQPRILPDSGSVKGQAVCAFAFHESWRGDRQSTEESVHLVVDQKVLYIGWPLGKTTKKMIFQPLNWKCYPWSFECGSNLTSQGTGFSLRWYLPRWLFCPFFCATAIWGPNGRLLNPHFRISIAHGASLRESEEGDESTTSDAAGR